MGTKSPTKWDAQLTESNFQTHPGTYMFRGFLRSAAQTVWKSSNKRAFSGIIYTEN
ncbi:DUF6783 domain-containing protein [Enterocloster hominis (ex Hitch et al. 2024)]|uniref:DUF6783 domain-containing protein n=1 Tax=Enterocloster hominis (ex Hitch et al. 2024) TaxID=1917870 RepID=UPI002E36A1C4|nr:DUF6783 domain-containing protein [Lachnoclostridium pacaense]